MLTLQGPVAAGQFGMTLAITNGLLAASTAWPTSQAPRYGALVARRAFAELDAGFVQTAVRSGLLALAGALGVLAGAELLRYTGHPLASRLLARAPFTWIVATALLNHVAITLAIYLRAFRREPLLIPSVAGGVVTVAVVAACARWSTVDRTAWAYFVLNAAGLVLTSVIFIRCRRRWQAESSGAGAPVTISDPVTDVVAGVVA